MALRSGIEWMISVKDLRFELLSWKSREPCLMELATVLSIIDTKLLWGDQSFNAKPPIGVSGSLFHSFFEMGPYIFGGSIVAIFNDLSDIPIGQTFFAVRPTSKLIGHRDVLC